uniref:GG11605 n=1 Tax=Drosophila erecta TaxID=7220 RepID=B3P5R8_DROER
MVARMWVFGALVHGVPTTRHTNMKCEVHDESFVEVKQCRLKVLGRGIIGANVYLKLKVMPVKTVNVNFSVWKKLSGYHPYLFNTTVDVCHILKHPNPSNVFFYFYRALKPYFNANHSCPFNHDIILKNFVLDDKMFSLFPIPMGNYMFAIKIMANEALRLTIFSYMDVNVDKL